MSAMVGGLADAVQGDVRQDLVAGALPLRAAPEPVPIGLWAPTHTLTHTHTHTHTNVTTATTREKWR